MLGRVFACAALVGLAGCKSGPEAVEAPGNGFLGALALPAVGPQRQAATDLSGRVVLVNFLATWCFPCVAELPTLEALQRDFGPQGFQVVGVGMDLEGAQVLAPFAEHYELRFPVLVADERIRSGQSPFGTIGALPTSFILDRQGRVVGAWQGVAGHEAMSQAIEKTLKRR
ncbi:TlpA family protein disulfide reductase [Hyalangium versicolor]|uniref:TlpA family protein disulfide reductase n=1 Tax=Hyalangium versicolor TaxID=2861190 RepID=UPI001CCB5D15|nr:TlpA disulfide reductase family protein [Hyalangium versicolor]